MTIVRMGALASAFVAALIGFWLLQSSVTSAAGAWEAVNPDVSTGKGVRLEIRLVGSKPITGPITVQAVRLDMGPDETTAPSMPSGASTLGNSGAGCAG